MNSMKTLQVTAPSDREIRMKRVFDAPRRLVWDALTKPELLKRWFYGPPGWTLEVCEMDLRAGGAYRWLWRDPKGEEMGLRGVFREIVPLERIVASAKFDESWYPGEELDTTVLTEHGGKTTLTLTVLYESKEARDTVLKTRMSDGVTMNYDRLAEMLAADSI
jgi:uncharacterized protein YndB with AHSA1/START domain